MEYINLGDYEDEVFKVVTNPHDTVCVVIMDHDGFTNPENHKHLRETGIYFLVDREQDSIYIGESYDLIGRMRQHKNVKFTDIAILVYRQSGALSKGEINYLEKHFIGYFKGNGFNVVNGNDGHSKADNGLWGHQKHRLDAFRDEVTRLIACDHVSEFLPSADIVELEEEPVSRRAKRKATKKSPKFVLPKIVSGPVLSRPVNSGNMKASGDKTTQYLYETETIDVLLSVDTAKISERALKGILFVFGKAMNRAQKKEVSKKSGADQGKE